MRTSARFRTRPRRLRTAAGFTLIELMVTLVVLAVVAVTLIAVLLAGQRSKSSTANSVETAQQARVAMEMMARDLRSAGYGADLDYVLAPQPPIQYIDSTQVILSQNLLPWPDSTTVAGVPAHQAPLAFDPAASPRPAPLNGTAWTPPVKYGTGAELIRYTLDVNNDGQVDAADVAAANGVDAQRTPNPNDYVLVREVYGETAPGNNGGQTERIALVRKPGGTAPPMFRVYMQGFSQPYDWSAGPVPTSQLSRIERIEVNVTATSPKPDWRGQYAQTVLSTTVNSMRNTPSFGQPTYSVSGWVRLDTNGNNSADAGEPGIPGALVRLGLVYTNYTDANGYFQFAVPAGTYTLRHNPPPGYGVASVDSFVVTVPAPQQRSFADTLRTGGFVHVRAFRDLDGDGVQQGGEPGVGAVRVTLTPPGTSSYTNANGDDSLFASVGVYLVSASPPDSFVVSSTNPQPGVMVDRGSNLHTFALSQNATGKVQGTVFTDNNRNGVLDSGEPGIADVWVGVTNDGGITTLGWAYTDVKGAYDITVSINDPPRTNAYSVYVIPPAGAFPTGPTSIGNLWVQADAVLTGKNFGMATYQVIRLNASRVLSLSSGDLIEQDWNGSISQWATKGHADADIVLGADAGGTDNVSVWFNRYSDSPLFAASPADPNGYTRNAPQSVLSIALDTLDTGTPVQRPDVVTGTKVTASGNFFVWLNQNTSGNLGFIPASYSPGLNYRTQDDGDVSAVLSYDCAGGSMPDLIVGTKSPTSGNGTFEVWENSGGASPTFSRQETYPPAGSIPGSRMGEVTAMGLADFNNDGLKDLVVGTKTGTYSGEIKLFKFSTKANNNRFIHANTYSTSGMAITALTILDLNGDGLQDLVVGVQDGVGSGHLQYWRNKDSFEFDMARQVDAPGLVLSLVAADLGGSARRDIAMGWRLNETSYLGGIRIYYTDLGVLPSTGVDPSSGSVINMVPALTTNNFNYGVQPSTPSPPYLPDLAAGVKVTALTGALVVFIR